MKLKVDAAENDIKKDQEACKQEMEQIKAYNAGSPDYKRLEADILKKQGDLNLKVKLQQKDFMEQEGRVYYGISREIDDAVRLLAARNNIVLVLRFRATRSTRAIATTFFVESTNRLCITTSRWISPRWFWAN